MDFYKRLIIQELITDFRFSISKSNILSQNSFWPKTLKLNSKK